MRRWGRIIDCASYETTAREATGARQGLEAKFADSKLGRITHLDDTYLIHMNGRVYDYRLGRFLSVDPIISNPANSQSINPYSYIGNNPLSGTDPTGYEECGTSGPCNTTGVQQRIETTGSHILGTPGQLSAPVSNVTVNGTPITPGLIAAANAACNAQRV